MNKILQSVQKYETLILQKGEFPYELSSLILTSSSKLFDWDLFAKVFLLEKNMGKNSYFHSAHIAGELMRPKIKTSLNKYFNGEFEISSQDEENLTTNILISFNEALKTYDEEKGKFPVLCENYIKEALRVTFQNDSTYYERNKEREKALKKGYSEDDVDEYITNLYTPVFWGDLKNNTKSEKKNNSESLLNIIPANTNVEEDYEDKELNDTIRTMFNFFRLCGNYKDKVDLLVAFNTWSTFLPLFKDNEALFNEFKKRVNRYAEKTIKKEVVVEMEVE